MQQPTPLKLFRITHNPARQGLIKNQRAVHLAIHKPVLDEYNQISLDKQSSYVRIKHKCTSMHFKSQDSRYSQGSKSPSNKLWEDTVNRYIQSKRVIQLKRGQPDIAFGFHPLDRTNVNRYKKMVSEEALPIEIIKITVENEQKFSSNPSRKLFRNSFEANRDTKSKLSTKRLTTVQREQKDLLTRSMPEALLQTTGTTASQERVLQSFIQKYFRNKYKRQLKEKNELRGRGYGFPRRNTD